MRARTRLLALTMVVAGCALAAPAAQAIAPASVSITEFSPTVSGHLTSGEAGVNVNVSLVRGGTTIVSALTSTDAGGSWTVDLPGHAPACGCDEVDVLYGPQITPPIAQFTPISLGDFILANQLITPTDAMVGDPSFGGPSTYSSVLVDQNGTTTPATYDSGTGVWDVPGTYTDDDALSATEIEPVGMADVSVTVPAPLLDQPRAPACDADLVTFVVSCSDLNPGSYLISQIRGGSTIDSHIATVSCGCSGIGAATFASMQTGDQIELQADSGAGRTLTTLHVGQLLVHDDDGIATGQCTADNFLDPVSQCASDGSIPSLPTPAGVVDDFSGGETVVTLPQLGQTAPMPGESMFGSFQAFADVTVDGAPAADPVTLALLGFSSSDPPNPIGTVDPDSGLAVAAQPVGRYHAIWTISDPRGDTTIARTTYVQQSGTSGPAGPAGPAGAPGTPGAAGAAGSQGAAGSSGAPGANGTNGTNGAPGADGAPGAKGATGPRGPSGKTGKVTCKAAKARHGRLKVTCRVRFSSAVGHSVVHLRLARGRTLLASGHHTASGSGATVTMSARRVPRGVYTVTLRVGSGASFTQLVRIG